MSDPAPAQNDGIELHAMKPAEGGVAGGPPEVLQEPLIDLDDIGDVEKGVSPPATPVVPEQVDDAAPAPDVPTAPSKKPDLMVRLREKWFQRDILKFISFLVMGLLAFFTIIGLGVVVGVQQEIIGALKGELYNATATAGVAVRAAEATGAMMQGSGYVNGYSAFLEAHGARHVGRDAVVQTNSDDCDDETTAYVQSIMTATVPVWTEFVNSTVFATATGTNQNTSILAVFTNSSSKASVTDVSSVAVSGPVVTPFLATTTSVNMTPHNSSSSTSASLTSTRSTQTCGEWGDGAGPCARPYGLPNTTPASALSSLALESQVGSTNSNTFTSPFTEASALVSSSTSLTVNTNLTGMVSPATVTVTVTAGSCSNTVENITGIGTTLWGTSTLISSRTATVNAGGGGPLTTTETVFWRNSSSVTSANYTLTLQQTVVPASSFIFSSAGSVASGASPLITSGGEQSAPKPLGASGTGNGVYCVVMLVTLVALLI